MTALGGIGLDQPFLAAAGGFVACVGVLLHLRARYLAGRLRRALAAALVPDDRRLVFERLGEVLESSARADWVALVKWEEDGLGGTLELERGDGPQERTLMSWLVREAESRDELLTAPAHELGGYDGAVVALPLRRENSALVGFVVLHAPRALRRHVRNALTGSLDTIGLALAERPEALQEASPAAVTA